MGSKIDGNAVGLAGEFTVLAQLQMRPKLQATFTLGHTKSVDIVVVNGRQKPIRVQVKASHRGPRSIKRGKYGRNYYAWPMDRKDEARSDVDVCCFVKFIPPKTSGGSWSSRFFVVPWRDVRTNLRWGYQQYLRAEKRRPAAGRNIGFREFRIPVGREERAPACVPPSCRRGARWLRYENDWGWLSRSPARS